MQHKRKFTMRQVILIILFCMIVVCSGLSFSYAYYSSTASNKTGFRKQNLTVECLNITATTWSSSLPGYFTSMSDYAALHYSGEGCVDCGTTNQPFGMVTFTFQNSCAADVYADVLFVPNSSNTMSLNDIKYAICNGYSAQAGQCGGNSNYSNAYVLGNSCNTTSSAPC